MGSTCQPDGEGGSVIFQDMAHGPILAGMSSYLALNTTGLQNSLPREATGAPKLMVFNIELPRGAGNSLCSALLHWQRAGLHGPAQPATALHL